MIKYFYIAFILLNCNFSIPEKKVVKEIVRYETGNWNCSNSIELRRDKYFHNSCKWGKGNYNLINKQEITDFILLINDEMINKQINVKPHKGSCGITKYGYIVVLGETEYRFDEILCKEHSNSFLANKLHEIFEEINK